jgi:hypothetical protein
MLMQLVWTNVQFLFAMRYGVTMLAILGLLTPLVTLFVSWFIKDQAKKDAILARWNKALGQINAGTTDMNSAQALQAMWTELEANPTLNISAVFPTVEAIAAYVTPRMILGRQYLAYNLGRRAQFEQEKSAILAQ